MGVWVCGGGACSCTCTCVKIILVQFAAQSIRVIHKIVYKCTVIH